MLKAKKETGLAIITEVMSDRDVDLIAQYADVMQVGARNMQNFILLKALGKCRRPVLLKRGLSSTIKELLMSAEYIVAHGNSEIILCERGIRTFETATRNTCDIAAIPVLNELTHLPVILDPSHATGKRSLVPALCRASVAIGADGLIVEVHPAPEKAISDGAQSLDIPQFTKMMRDLRPYIDLWQLPGRVGWDQRSRSREDLVRVSGMLQPQHAHQRRLQFLTLGLALVFIFGAVIQRLF